MDELVRWLGEQLADDESAALGAKGETAGRWTQDDGPPEDIVLYDKSGKLTMGQARHIARHDPARVLREIEAKRAIVARYEFACREASRVDLAEDERETWIRVGGALQSVVIQLAAPYAGRPGFKAEEWAP
jgi:hypothetical protein